MIRLIEGFHQDPNGEWVAELSCLHRQHVRHQPPFVDRAWVLSETGRKKQLGGAIQCPLCDRSEIPDGLVVARTLGPFDQWALPPALQRNHRLPPYTWGRLRVTRGSCRLRIDTDPPFARELGAGDSQVIPPEVSHAVGIHGDVSLAVDLLRAAH